MDLQFDEIARKAARGELSGTEREWLDDYLRVHPERRPDLDWHAAFQARLAERTDAMPAMPGWERTQRILTARAENEARELAPLDRLSDWMRATFGWTVNLQALAAAVVLAQAAVIGTLMWGSRPYDYSEVRSGVQTEAPRGPLLRVSFRDDIREAELRKALADVGGEIVGGPGQIGVYLVRVRDTPLATAAAQLRATGLTALVEIYEPKR